MLSLTLSTFGLNRILLLINRRTDIFILILKYYVLAKLYCYYYFSFNIIL